jgi:hypothetical protein
MAVNPDDAKPGEHKPDEPWLRGPVAGVHPLLGATLHAYMQAEEDLAQWTGGLTVAQIWSRPHGLAPVGFQLRHIAGSVDRLTTYLRGEQLTTQQLEAARSEMEPGASRDELLEMVSHAIQDSQRVIRAITPDTFSDARAVGRKRLPTTVAALVVHLAEHTQRHVGQLIVTSKVVRAA